VTALDDSPPWDIGPVFSAVSLEKLAASALTPEYALERGVLPVNRPEDLPPEFAANAGLCTVPGMLFPWRDPRDPEQVTWQYRPDHPVEPAYKYVFPEGLHQPLGLVKAGDGNRVAIVEGTLQGLAFSRYAPDDLPVYSIPGCDGWSKAKNATENLIVVEGKDVVVFLDADALTNASVYDAGHELARFAKIYGATGTFFARAPGRGVNGIDDFLGSAAEDKRTELLARLMDNPEQKPAPRKPPGKPKAKSVYGLATAEGLPDANDTALGTQWADSMLMNYRWLVDDESWLACRAGRWERVGSSVPASSVMKFLSYVSGLYLGAAQGKDGDQREKLEETGRQLLSSAKRTSVRLSASDYDATHVRRAELDQHPRKFCVANGVLDLDTLEVTGHDPNLLLTTGSGIEFAPGAPCARFDQFLADVQPDPELRAYVMRIFAMAMYGEVREHILPVMIGEGRNGKGTLMRIMHNVFGSHAEVIESSALLMRKYEKHEEEVARLAGKRLITTEETGRDAQWNVPRINSWTGGDRLKGRWMGGNSFSFAPSHTLVMATNHRPNVGQGERAFWARYKEIPFGVDFTDRVDLTLEPWIIENELPGVLNRLIEAGHSYRAHGLQEPSAVTMATLDAKVDADNLARFCAEHIAVTGDHELDRIFNVEMFESINKWWSQNVRGEAPPGARTFGKQMRQALGMPADAKNPKKIGKGQDSKLTWTGIRWLNGGRPDGLPHLPGLPHVAADLNKGNENQGPPNQGDPNNWSAASEPWSAAKSADTDDQETENVPAQSLVSAKSAESAVKVRSKSVDLEEAVEPPVDHGLKSSSQEPWKENGTDRQTRQTQQLNGVLTFDLETDDADLQHDHPEPEKFVRLAGYSTGNGTITDASARDLIDNLLSSRYVMGSNLVHFDLPVLARIDSRVDVLELTAQGRVLDTMITESVLNPILNDKRPNAVGRAMVHFKLENACKRYGIPGKTNDAKKMAKEHGGFDKIPLEELDPYLRGDVEASKGLSMVMMQMLNSAPAALQSYVMREHQVHALASTMGAIGIQVDQELLQRRFWAGFGKKQRLTRKLIDKYDIPTVKADGKPADSPAATKDGKAALLRAFASLNVPESVMARTAKGAISFGGDAMRELAEQMAEIEHPNIEEIALLCDTVADIAGVRTVYGTALDALCSDGRVHPQVATFQSSGRWSTTKPGLTVFGKRKGKVIERAVFTATGPNAWEAETVLFAIDLSQIDARSVAVLSQDHAYMDIFGIDPETGKPRDSHAEVALAVWGDKAMRERAKPISHGWNYNMGKAKLAATAGSRQVAEEFHAAMERNFPRLVQWKAEMVQAASTGAFMDNGFGRMMLPDPERAHNQGPALMGQGCARDLMMECFLRLRPALRRMLRIQVHDEAIFEIPKENAEEIRREIEAAFNFEWAPPSMPWARPIQILAEAGHFAYRWSECY